MAKEKARTREDSLRERVALILCAEKITAPMLFDLMMSGSSVWRQGMGLPYNYISEILEDEIKKAEKEKANV